MKKNVDRSKIIDCGARHAYNYSGFARRRAYDVMIFHLLWLWSGKRGSHYSPLERAKYTAKVMRPKLRLELWGFR